jgi:hypothetical protein
VKRGGTLSSSSSNLGQGPGHCERSRLNGIASLHAEVRAVSNGFVRRFGTQAWQSGEAVARIHLESKKDMNKKNEDKRWVILFIIVAILSLIGVSVLTFILTKLIKG